MFLNLRKTLINMDLMKTCFPSNIEGTFIKFYHGNDDSMRFSFDEFIKFYHGNDDSMRFSFDDKETRDKIFKKIIDAIKNGERYLEIEE